MFLLYCYNSQGYHNGAIEIKDDVQSVARAIMYYGQKGDLVITDMMDELVCNTIGNFIDRWSGHGASFGLEDLKEVIIPMQMTNKIPKKLDFLVQR